MLSPQDLITFGGVDASCFEVVGSGDTAKVTMDLGALIGQSVISLSDLCMPEVYLKLHLALYRAQTAYNATKPSGARIGAWTDIGSGQAQYYSSLTPPGYYSNWTTQASFLVPSSVDTVLPILQ